MKKILTKEDLSNFDGEIAEFGYANYGRSARDLARMVEHKTAVFDNAVQRGLIWDTKRKSRFIRNMLLKLKTQPLFANMTVVDGVKIYDFVDGKQRANTVHEYFTDKFALSADTPLIEVVSAKGEHMFADISNMKFSELPDEFRHQLETYQFVVYFTEDATTEQIAEQFFGLNNGKPLSAIEKIRVMTKCPDAYSKIADHPIMATMFSEKSLRNNSFETALKAFAVTMMDEPCLDSASIDDFAKTEDISASNVKEMSQLLTFVQGIHDYLVSDQFVESFVENHNDSNKLTKKRARLAAKKMYQKTNFFPLLRAIAEKSQVPASNIVSDPEGVAEALYAFFGIPETDMSQDKDYNQAAIQGINHTDKLKVRIDILSDYL